MVILDRYTQISFETTNETHKFTGICNIKDNKIILVDVTIYDLSTEYRLGTMSLGESQGASINIINITDMTYLSQFVEVLKTIKIDLEKQLL
jgi:hypothetical protein